MVNHPRLTVVLPAHNAEATIAAAIQSVLHQSYTEFELWVLENGSSDRTAEVARSISDPRVKVFELGSIGFQSALGYALENAETEWLARMDADDLSFPDRFKEQVEVIEQRPDLVLVGTQRAYLTPFGHIFEPVRMESSREVNRLSLRSKGSDAKFFVDPSVIFRRSVALDVGGYDPEFETGDVPLWFRMLSRGKGWEIAKPLYLYRLHPTSMGYSQAKSSDQSYRLVAKYAPELLPLYPEPLRGPSEESVQHPEALARHKKQLWLRIAKMELMTGDRRAALQAAEFLEHDGLFEKTARRIRWFSYLGRVGGIYYRWHRRHHYRHRPDWEQLFTSMVGSRSLEQRIYFRKNS